jgi:hypothetical protein
MFFRDFDVFFLGTAMLILLFPVADKDATQIASR